MKQYHTLSFEEKSLIHSLGKDFFERHANHVQLIMKHADIEIAPSGQDLMHPELWKGIHWKWFFSKPMAQEYSQKFVSTETKWTFRIAFTMISLSCLFIFIVFVFGVWLRWF